MASAAQANTRSSVAFEVPAALDRPDLVFDLFDGHDGFFTGSAFGAGLLNRPEGERLPCFKAGISVINKVKPTVATGTDSRFVCSEGKGVK